MNTQHNLITAISKSEAAQQTTAVNEPVSIETNCVTSFTVADLWNIQRQKKPIVRRRYLA